jgi:UDP-N-acetylmuramyl pentapeptide phosphotransferase/UDP-N-acetylglucosamine-1-phosphate transferase
MPLLLFVCAALSFVAGAWLVRYAHGHTRRYSPDMPQRFHAGHVPRLGGVAIGLSWLLALLWLGLSVPLGLSFQVRFAPGHLLGCALVVAVSTGAGVCEDLTQRLAALSRLGLTLVAGVLAAWALDLAVPRVGLGLVDAWWGAAGWPGVALAVLAIAGLPHAFNLIDGYNGLAGTVALVICLALAYVALQVGDRQMMALSLALAGATAGFLVWNYPRGLLFAGDGGAYLWGTAVALISVTLVQRHQAVSPWFPMLLLIYPVWETVFSIYRKAVRGVSPGVADALHFHQLIYRRIVRGVFHDDESRRMLMRNNRTAPYLWGFTLLTVVPAVLFWRNTPVLMALCGLFVVSYVYAYVTIVRFKVPQWLRR